MSLGSEVGRRLWSRLQCSRPVGRGAEGPEERTGQHQARPPEPPGEAGLSFAAYSHSKLRPVLDLEGNLEQPHIF